MYGGLTFPFKVVSENVGTNANRLLLIAPITGCFLRLDIKRFCLTFTIGPDRIWFCLIPVSDFFSTIIPRVWSKISFDSYL